MSTHRVSRGHIYIARRECGCLSGMAWDLPGGKRSLANTVSRWIARGDSVERHEAFVGDTPPRPLCQAHRTAAMACAPTTTPTAS